MTFLEENSKQIENLFTKFENNPDNNKDLVGCIIKLCEDRALYLMKQVVENDNGQIQNKIFSYLGKYYSDILINAISSEDPNEIHFGTYRYIISKIDELTEHNSNMVYMKYSLVTFPAIKPAFTLSEKTSFFINCIRIAIQDQKNLQRFGYLLDSLIKSIAEKSLTN